MSFMRNYRSFTGFFAFCLLLAPLSATAYTNVCEAVNAQCTATAVSKGNATCGPCIVGGFSIPGVCAKVNDCKESGQATEISTGAKVDISKLPTDVTDQLAGKDTSFLGKVGSFIQKNPLVSGLAIGAGTQLLSSLMSNSGSSANNSSPYTGVCMGQQYYSAAPNPNDPCAIYSPTGQPPSSSLTPTPQDNLNDLINQLSNNGSNSSSTSSLVDELGNASSSTLQTGDNSLGSTCSDGSFCAAGTQCSTVQPGHCYPEGNVDCGSFSCPAGDSCSTDGSNQCISGNQTNVLQTISDPSLYQNSGPGPAASTTPLNQNPIPVPADGLHGDLLSFGGGVTIYAQNRTGNTEVSGFYGGSGGAGGMCDQRPWASNFLSYIIPPGFFDSLCSLAGFPTGGSTSSGFGGGGGNGGVQVVSGPQTPGVPTQSAQSDIAPVAKIAASPASVNVGGRTTVFWTSRNVASCEESSSDGNFQGTSVSGGASTVSLSGPVTFYITCLGLDGTKVTNSVTVNIGI